VQITLPKQQSPNVRNAEKDCVCNAYTTSKNLYVPHAVKH